MSQGLSFHLKTTNQQHPKQYGFKEGASTDHALDSLLSTLEVHRRNKKHVAIVSIDIKGAFDNLKYSSINSHPVNSRCPQNIQKLFGHLLQDRKVVIPTNEGVAQHI
ncbi:hypothetical protein AVEN_118852-1 [Araneus ventricosus]|uniref:Uncharacterized protein n=1 Tax=Araneus ventricosus TaxID=182803 RepID=A0A4Y2WJJ2_ARAVE|nr:hypothetical protein AVEN_118852-1 [Araneus ventricosus]